MGVSVSESFFLEEIAIARNSASKKAEFLTKYCKLLKIWHAAKAPNEAQDDRLKALEDWKETVDRRLTAGDSHFEKLDNGNRVTQLALLALLDHGIDGNNIQQMQHAKEELQSHLINR